MFALCSVIARANDMSVLHNPGPQCQINVQLSPNMFLLVGPAERLRWSLALGA